MLRSYRYIEEIVRCFLAIKAYLLKSLANGVSPKSKTPAKPTEVAQNSEPSPSTSASPVIGSQNKVSRGTKSLNTKKTASQAVPAQMQVEKELFQSPLKIVPQQTQRKTGPQTNEVQCPVCQASMRESVINSHLDTCLSRMQEKRKPMPKLIYNLMKDAELKKRLKELGLSTTGDRSTLVNRHKKYTILYNSECDSANPRPVIELRAQLEREEAESRRLAHVTSPRVKKADPETIEKENQQYVQNNKDSYKQLIEEVKMRQEQAKSSARKTENQRAHEPDQPLPSTSAQAQHEDERLSETEAPETTEKTAEEKRTGTEAQDDEEITVLPTPVKVYETVSLLDSDEETSIGNFTNVKRRMFSESEKSSHLTSEESSSTFPDPMASSDGTPRWTDNSNTAWSPSITYKREDEVPSTPASPSYSPLDDDKSPDLFRQESSSSGSSTPVTSRQRASKRNKSQMDGSSEKRKSSRRRI